ncbi:cupin domain-containing protein [Lacrimispora sp.]|uniref:cupin domain-containing protein n=1 Tax=Lacrimispora sp. TaxID=2719234 RepID=UPI0028A62557|nr:cupin domain-containing protein [Lacrimispora sp.]
MQTGVYTILKKHVPKSGMTISTNAKIGKKSIVHHFSLGSGTDISSEAYDNPVIYIGAYGTGLFDIGTEGNCKLQMNSQNIIFLHEGTLCGVNSIGEEGLIYTEIQFEKESKMNEILKANEVFNLKNLIDYEEGSIANIDLASGEGMKFMILSFDDGCMLSEHRAPGDALFFALEGKATITYEGKSYNIREGENFRFENNRLHSVKAEGKFKMALLLTLD